MTRILAVALCLVAGAAWAQPHPDMPNGWTMGNGSATETESFYSAKAWPGTVGDISHAMDICNEHRLPFAEQYTALAPSGVLPWEPEFAKDCAAVQSLWDQSEAARIARARAAQVEQDRAFLRAFLEDK